MRHLIIYSFFTLLLAQQSFAEEKLNPYLLVASNHESAEEALAVVRESLEGSFDIVGEYSPNENTVILALTNEDLRSTAAQSVNGGFGAVIRLSVSTVAGTVQIAYVNPDYLSNIYRMEDLSSVSSLLTASLGEATPFGSKKGLTAKKLRKYHYMMGMPYFDDVDLLAEHDSYQQALDAVEKNLSQGVAGASKVYRVDLPGKDETLFGVGLSLGKGADNIVMEVADLGEIKHSPHLPYEILVSGKKVMALRGRFRIAQSFPDLTMGTFMKIRSAPGAIKEVLQQVAQP